MDDYIFNLKFQSKQLKREGDRQIKEMDKFKQKAAKELKANNIDAATIYADHAIKCAKQSAAYINLSCKLQIIAGQISSQQLNRAAISEVVKVNKVLENVTDSSTLLQNSKVMTVFEKQIKELSISQKVINNSMGTTTGVEQMSANQLLEQIATEQAEQLRQEVTLSNLKDAQEQQKQQQKEQNKLQEEELYKRMQQLQQ